MYFEKSFISQLIQQNQISKYVLIDIIYGYNTMELLFLNHETKEVFSYREFENDSICEKINIPDDKFYYNLICSINH